MYQQLRASGVGHAQRPAHVPAPPRPPEAVHLPGVVLVMVLLIHGKYFPIKP